jgi:hypothetical protein
MYRGDVRLGDTIDLKFTTRSFTTGAPTTLAGTPVISAYVGNSTTQLTAGITLTVDFDAVTGLHNIRVVATSGNGYATASNYDLVITTGTVGGVSVVGEVVGSFSIEARSAVMPTTAARTLDISSTGEAGVDWANVGTPSSTVNLSATTVATVTTAATATNVTTVNGLAANVITAASIAADAITDAKVASDVTIASVTGSVGSVTGAVGSVTGAVGSVTGSVGSVAAGGITEASFATTAGSVSPLGIIDQGTAQSATGTTLVLRAAAAFANSEIVGATILITGGSAGVGQSRVITGYVSATDTATVDTWTTTPTGTITYKIFSTPPASSSSPPAVNLTHVNGAAQTATLDTIKADTAATLTDTAEIGTAGAGLTNINLPNQTMDITGNITGSLSGSVGSVTGAVGSVTASVSITSNVKKNQALANFEYVMTDSTTHAPVTGKTVTCTRSIDGGAFAAGTLANVAEVGSGIYRVDFGAGDLNGNVITLRATAATSDDCMVTLVTAP